MQREDCFELGKFGKTHGLQGEIVLHLDVDEPAYYDTLDALFVEENAVLVPFFVERVARNGRQARLKLEDVDNIGAARSLSGKTAFLPLSALPPLDEGEVFLHDMVGFTIHDEVKGEVGTITGVYDLPKNPLLVVDRAGKEVLLPLQDDFLEEINTTQKQVRMRLPEGILDLDEDETDADQ